MGMTEGGQDLLGMWKSGNQEKTWGMNSVSSVPEFYIQIGSCLRIF